MDACDYFFDLELKLVSHSYTIIIQSNIEHGETQPPWRKNQNLRRGSHPTSGRQKASKIKKSRSACLTSGRLRVTKQFDDI